MGIMEISAIIVGASQLMKTAVEILMRLQRDPGAQITPSEIAKLKAEQLAVDESWADQLASMRKDAEPNRFD